MTDSRTDRPELATWAAGHDRRLREGGHVGILLPCYNEAGNIDELYDRLSTVLAELPKYTFDILFIDNASTDGTVDKLRELVARDPRVRVIVNARNFGHIRSPFHGLMECSGDCVIALATDLQDPPELIPRFLDAWENGASVAVGQKKTSEEPAFIWAARSAYYRLARHMADAPLLDHVTGFGLYDRRVIEILRSCRDPYPYLRGLICELGLPVSIIQYDQPLRRRGLTKNNFFTLFDMAMLGITSHSKVPLRMATIMGFVLSAVSLGMAVCFLILKLLYWEWLGAGYATGVVSTFFLASVQIFLLGLVGEYVGAVLTQVRDRPLIVELKRLPTQSADEGAGDTEESALKSS